MGNELFSPSGGKAYRTDGSIANTADSYDLENRKITIENFNNEINEGNGFGFKYEVTLAAGESVTGFLRPTTKSIYYQDSSIRVIDKDNQIINVNLEYFKGATVNSGTPGDPNSVINLNDDSELITTAEIFLPADLDLTNKVVLPFGGTIVSDRKSAGSDSFYRQYVNTQGAGVTITNNGIGSVDIEYFDYWYE